MLEFKKKIYKNMNIINNNKMTVLDLFCGMSKGLENTGLDIIAGIDIWNKAIENFNHHAICYNCRRPTVSRIFYSW